MPALMNTPSWRLKCISSRGLTFFLVISYWKMLFFAATLIGTSSRSLSREWTSRSEGASSTPTTRVPSSARAVNWYFAIRCLSASQRVDRSDHFSQRRHVAVDEPDRLLLEGAHSLLHRETLQFLLGRPADDQTLDLRRDVQELVHTDAVLIAGVRAEVAAGAVEEGRAVRICATGLHVEG